MTYDNAKVEILVLAENVKAAQAEVKRLRAESDRCEHASSEAEEAWLNAEVRLGKAKRALLEGAGAELHEPLNDIKTKVKAIRNEDT